MCQAVITQGGVRYFIDVAFGWTYNITANLSKEVKMTTSNSSGKGWHGDSKGHARAGRKGGSVSSGNFKNDPRRAALAGRIGGRISPGNFKNDPERARSAGKKGGSK